MDSNLKCSSFICRNAKVIIAKFGDFLSFHLTKLVNVVSHFPDGLQQRDEPNQLGIAVFQ